MKTSETTQAPLNPRHYGVLGLWPWLVAVVAVAFFGFFILPYLGDVQRDIIIYSGINIILAVSLNLVNGFTGQFSMGHAGFMAVGAYTSAFLSMPIPFPFREETSGGVIQMGMSLPFPVALLGAGIIAALMGYAVGIPSLRLKGDYLAIVTLGFGEIIRVLFLNMNFIGGARGLPGVPKNTNFMWVYILAVITVFTVWRMIGSSHGRPLLAVREDEIAAESMGVDTTKAKVRAFALGAFFAGIAGGLFAHYLTFITPSIFDFNKSFEIIIMVVLGGMGSLTGSIFAAVFLTFLREYLRDLQSMGATFISDHFPSLQQYTQVDLRMIIYSLILIILMLTRPNGIFGTNEIQDVVRRWRMKRQEA